MSNPALSWKPKGKKLIIGGGCFGKTNDLLGWRFDYGGLSA